MAKIVKELIEYNCEESYDRKRLVNFKQFSINNIFNVPIEKPDIDQITKVWVDYDICDYEFVKTPRGSSSEGQILTGNKLFISANLKVKLEYVSLKSSQSVHSMHTTIPLCAYVTLQDDSNEFSDTLPSLGIEDIYCELMNCREIYINIVLIAIVDVC